jgi:hypothetical protein
MAAVWNMMTHKDKNQFIKHLPMRVLRTDSTCRTQGCNGKFLYEECDFPPGGFGIPHIFKDYFTGYKVWACDKCGYFQVSLRTKK